MRTPPLTSQRPHLQILSHWGSGLPKTDFGGEEGSVVHNRGVAEASKKAVCFVSRYSGGSVR